MTQVEAFLNSQEEQSIIEAIIKAEKNTSGEIRVHIEATTNIDHFSRAQQLFYFLKMHNTKAANAVLIYVAVQDKKFVIYGDKGIDQAVPKGFWESTKNAMAKEFALGNFTQGIITGVLKAGEELQVHFPWQKNDVNELPNSISKG